MAARSHRPKPVKSTERKAPPSVDSKLKKWGDCPGQQSMFDESATWTPEIRAYRERTNQ